jgi:anhydro-N-acetylmuramic acid kinase
MAMKGKRRVVVGLMSGTSADGIDAVAAEIGPRNPGLSARLLGHVHTAFPRALRERIVKAGLNGTVREICELNFVLGEEFARATLSLLRRAALQPSRVAAIGSHGQTVHHLPSGQPPSTLQIGEAAIIAQRTGITTISDFRVRDMAAGGQGAPLVSYADWALFTDAARPRLIQNIGGIANVTFVPPKARLQQVLAFDTGPGNMVIDGVVSTLSSGRQGYDLNGGEARNGKVCEPLLTELMAHPFFQRRPPKTTGREEFGEPFIRSILAFARRRRLSRPDILATVTALTAASIAQAYRRFVFPGLSERDRGRLQVILGGGGTRNRTLLSMLADNVKQFGVSAEWLSHEDFDIPNAAKEALAFAILAYQTLAGRTSNVPGATGARQAVVLGKVTPA